MSQNATAKDFWNFLTNGLDSKDFIEIRCVSVLNNRVYDIIRDFASKHNIFCRNNCQLFFNSTDENSFLEFMNLDFVLSNCKTCYGLSPRQKDLNGDLSGGYRNINFATMIFFDIEKVVHSDTSEQDKVLMLEYVHRVAKFLERMNLVYSVIVDSGAGYHLLYRISTTKITESRKRWFKFLIETIAGKCKSDLFKIDAIFDLTRIFGLPGSMNVKRNKRVSIVKFDPSINTDFKFRSKREVKSNVNYSNVKYSVDFDGLVNEPLVKFMMYFKHSALQHGGSLSRNNYLELPLACLLRDSGLNVESVANIINVINSNMNKKVQVKPEYVPKDYVFSKSVVNKWSLKECGLLVYK